MALCRECGEWFVPEDVWDVYCSPECAKAEWLREVKARKLSLSHQKKSLSQTGNSPIPPKSSPIPHEESEPQAAIEATAMAEAGRSARQCVCAVCGREFTAACNNAKICSDECRRMWKRVYEARNRAKTNGKEMVTKTCCICKHTFVTTNKDKECCSTKCRCKLELEKKKGKLRTCPECGKVFGSNLSAAKYCSTKCRDAAEKKRKKAHHGHICTVCGKEFALEGRHSRKYCSEECAKKAQNAQCVQYQTQIRNELLPPPTRKCHDCGAPTSNYRCPRCLSDWKIKHAVSGAGDVDERYSICR